MKELLKELEDLREQLMKSGKECYEHSAYGVDYAIGIVLRRMRESENAIKEN